MDKFITSNHEPRQRAKSVGSGSRGRHGQQQQQTQGKRKRHLSSLAEQQAVEALYREVQAFLLAPSLVWCMWAMVHSTNDKIPFGYWVSQYIERLSYIVVRLPSASQYQLYTC